MNMRIDTERDIIELSYDGTWCEFKFDKIDVPFIYENIKFINWCQNKNWHQKSHGTYMIYHGGKHTTLSRVLYERRFGKLPKKTRVYLNSDNQFDLRMSNLVIK